MRTGRKLLLLTLAFALTAALSGCLETEAKLTWHPDGSIDLKLRLEGDALSGQGGRIAEQLRLSGFRDVRLSATRLSAVEPLKLAGWDRLSGWLPGRFAFADRSGLVFSRTSWVVFEDYALAGTLDVGRVAELPPFVRALGLPFVFKVEAPWPALSSNAVRVEGRTYVWQARLGQPFPVRIVYRRWYPERALALALALGALSLVLWRRSRRRPRV
ncbi:hypothetical protein ACMC9I_02845 [Deinococcota bacterium DY0809b]